MHSIRRRICVILVGITVFALALTVIFVNVTMNDKFNKYMIDIQNKRNERIVTYFQEVYKRDMTWKDTSGSEMRHEAYMSNYCLTLLDLKKEVVWTMDPGELEVRIHSMMMSGENKGVFNSTSFPIKVEEATVGYVSIGQYSSILLSEEDVNFKSSINKNIILSAVLTLLMAILISIYISKQFSTPIKEVSDISVKLSKGNYNSRSNTKSSILELENLRNSINTLGEKLNQQDLLRKRLVSDIAHEIRTPLNILENNLEAMIDGVFPVTNERLVSLNDEVIRFGKLLNNLNVLKEIEAEDITLNLKALSLKELISKEVEAFSLVLKEKEISINYNAAKDDSFQISGDEDKLKQVFINLLSNAVKFNKEKGEICIHIFRKDEQIIVKVKDNGIGIKKQDIPYIFERLYRGDKSRHEIEGSGIGLTVAKNIMLLHSGAIEVESEEGKGTTFSLSFRAFRGSKL